MCGAGRSKGRFQFMKVPCGPDAWRRLHQDEQPAPATQFPIRQAPESRRRGGKVLSKASGFSLRVEIALGSLLEARQLAGFPGIAAVELTRQQIGDRGRGFDGGTRIQKERTRAPR